VAENLSKEMTNTQAPTCQPLQWSSLPSFLQFRLR